jgi:hypothetical protein
MDSLVTQGATVFELFAGEDEALLVGGDILLILDLGLDTIDGVRGHAEMWRKAR